MPDGKVSLAAVSDQNQSVINSLKKIGIEVIRIGPYNSLKDNPEASHADMHLLPLGGKTVIVLKGSDFLKVKLSDYGFDVKLTDERPFDFKYPDCVKLNCVITGDSLICSERYIDKAVRKNLPHKTIINVRQGYSKCSAAIVERNAIITSDSSIFRAAVHNKIDCLKISEGHIDLCSKYHGFIGGACFKAEKNTLAFLGDIRKHPDFENIKSFCLNYRVNILSLMDGNLLDVGGVVPLKENKN